MTKKKFKELRMLIICLLLFILFLTIGLICFINKDILRAVIMLVCSFVALTLLLGRYNIILFDDSLMIYEFKIIAMLPILIEYKEIKSVEQKNKYKVVIKHKRKSSIYVLNSEKFIQSLNKCMK